MDEVKTSHGTHGQSGEIEKDVAKVDTINLEKSTLHIDDEAGDLAAQALASGRLDEAASKKVLRKIDLYILPFLCITYALQFIDKTSLGYSSVYGIFKDTHLVGQDYSWASSIFYFGYLISEYPGVAIIQRFPVAKFLAANIILWGAVLMTTAECHSFAGLATVRFFLGVTEATISPGFVAITGIWWTRQEQAGRSALWISFLGVGSLFGGLIAFGIGHITGSLSPWKYIYLILGAVTMSWGVLFFFVVPDSPTQVKWLTQEEKIIAVQRVIGNKTGTKSRTFVKAQVIEAVTDPKIIVLGLISFVNALASGGLSFGSLIIAGFGFSPIETTLMNMPLGAVQTVAQLTAGYLCTKIKSSRLIIASIAMVPPIIGTCLINQLHSTNKWGRLVGVWLLGSYPVGFMVILGLLSTNIAGSTKRSVASGWVFVCYCVGQISGPQFFKNSQKPAYHSGIVAMLCGFVLNLVLNQVLRVLYVRENAKRDKMIEGKGEEELAELQMESNIKGFENTTDSQNMMFRYVL
ncbi:MFS general substrate transporter [Mytilinidion resinicola]|uniref:MFS general substrate transporter n=1 Tax=Mytilinidion resinicola TaxID=574789 RepID=A0A6A6YGH0_9PEZI|nr:MFS general substrate transporter [Mytilinidion resinicola]KAF2807901.1 MFS general substrate transporter [Mytilinidion resinicola]